MKPILLPEIIAAGIFNAEQAIKTKTVSKNRKTTMFELELAIEDGGVSYINNTSHPIKENLVISAKPGQTRHTRLPFKCYYIHMILEEGELYDMLSSLPNYLKVKNSENIRDIFISLCEYHNSGTPEDTVMAESLVLKLIYMLIKATPIYERADREKRSNRETISGIIHYINSNLTADLSLAALADMAKFSPIYFHKLFKASTGKTLRDFVERQRIKRAVELLISTDMTLTEISYECGFSTQSYFSYAFKRNMGVTPREYVNKITSEYEKNQ